MGRRAVILAGLTLFGSAAVAQQRQAREPNMHAVAPVHESIVIIAAPLDPRIEYRSAEAFREMLFSRDDQVFHLLNAGVNAGQHEGGGKSLEIRRFGFNLDHGGASGGLRVTVDNVQQNQATQGHGQGYLGSLKSLSPELIDEVSLINGPFSAEHGDFSGLGVVQIRLRETMPHAWTFRLQGGSFDTARGLVAWSPNLARRDALLAYEGAYSNGPFLKPLGYERHNITGNYSWAPSEGRRWGLKWQGGTNGFQSSGQLPLDEVAAGRLSRFGSLSEGDGGRVQQGRLGLYFSQELDAGAVFKADGWIERSLFDLYSNFTFALNNPILGDAIQQHDSRLSQGGSLQYLRPQFFDFGSGTLTVGGSFLATQNNIDLRRVIDRDPFEVQGSAHAAVTSGGGFVQENIQLANGKIAFGGGLRWDMFRYAVTDQVEPRFSGAHVAAALQPKANFSFRPWAAHPFEAFVNYGRGVSSIDARSAARNPEGPRIATIDFLQAGWKHRLGERFSVLANYFLIRPSRQLVYIPDDGSIELAGPSQSHGFEVKTSFAITRRISFDGGLTKVLNAYFRDVLPRVYLDSAPRFAANAALTVAGLRGWSGSLRMRAINHYRLDGNDPSLLAAGHTVFDLALRRRLTSTIDLNLAVDNMLGRNYWETQNHFLSQLPGQQPQERIHATPGYGRTVSLGLTVRLGEK